MRCEKSGLKFSMVHWIRQCLAVQCDVLYESEKKNSKVNQLHLNEHRTNRIGIDDRKKSPMSKGHGIKIFIWLFCWKASKVNGQKVKEMHYYDCEWIKFRRRHPMSSVHKSSHTKRLVCVGSVRFGCKLPSQFTLAFTIEWRRSIHSSPSQCVSRLSTRHTNCCKLYQLFTHRTFFLFHLSYGFTLYLFHASSFFSSHRLFYFSLNSVASFPLISVSIFRFVLICPVTHMMHAYIVIRVCTTLAFVRALKMFYTFSDQNTDRQFQMNFTSYMQCVCRVKDTKIAVIAWHNTAF